MDFLTNYYTPLDQQRISVSAEQGSAFAKQVADDFNPIHHPDSRRFCVPGDLLFAIAVGRYGLHAKMDFRFLDLLNADVPVTYPLLSSAQPFNGDVVGGDVFTGDVFTGEVLNALGKPTLGIRCEGPISKDAGQQESLIRQYVAFSGHNFPDILVPLMREHAVMINPKRPLVIYQSMHLEFDHFDFSELNIELSETHLDVNGKRGDARLNFQLFEQGKAIGKGHKMLILSGLREYEESAIQAMCDEYARSKEA